MIRGSRGGEDVRCRRKRGRVENGESEWGGGVMWGREREEGG